MDVNATLRSIIDSLIDGDEDNAIDLIEALDRWTDRGGFQPTWTEAAWRVVFDFRLTKGLRLVNRPAVMA